MWRIALIALCIATAFPRTAKSQELPPSFDSLKTLHVKVTDIPGISFDPITIHYDSTITAVIDTVVELWPGDVDDKYATRLIRTKIDRTSNTYYTIDFSMGPSADPNFKFSLNVGDKLLMSKQVLTGTRLYVPGNGFLYVSGFTNNTFDQKRKFYIAGDTLVEVAQPYYYVGLTSTATRDLVLRTDPSDSTDASVVATVPKGSPVTILLKRADEKYPEFTYLLKTPFGLTGWLKVPADDLEIWYKNTPVEGLYFKGD